VKTIQFKKRTPEKKGGFSQEALWEGGTGVAKKRTANGTISRRKGGTTQKGVEKRRTPQGIPKFETRKGQLKRKGEKVQPLSKKLKPGKCVRGGEPKGLQAGRLKEKIRKRKRF